jgi:hypothetical protein
MFSPLLLTQSNAITIVDRERQPAKPRVMPVCALRVGIKLFGSELREMGLVDRFAWGPCS